MICTASSNELEDWIDAALDAVSVEQIFNG